MVDKVCYWKLLRALNSFYLIHSDDRIVIHFYCITAIQTSEKIYPSYFVWKTFFSKTAEVQSRFTCSHSKLICYK